MRLAYLIIPGLLGILLFVGFCHESESNDQDAPPASESTLSLHLDLTMLGLEAYMQEIEQIYGFINQLIHTSTDPLTLSLNEETDHVTEEETNLVKAVDEFWTQHYKQYNSFYSTLEQMDNPNRIHVFETALSYPVFYRLLKTLQDHQYLLDTYPHLAQLFAFWSTLIY